LRNIYGHCRLIGIPRLAGKQIASIWLEAEKATNQTATAAEVLALSLLSAAAASFAAT